MRAFLILMILVLSMPVFADDFRRLNDEQIKSLRSEKEVVLINFWATWCQPCQTELPALNRLKRKYPDVAFVGINVDDRENRGAIRGFLKKYPIEYDIFLRDGQNFERLATAFQDDWKQGLPATFLYVDGKKVFGKVGAIDEEELESALKTIQ